MDNSKLFITHNHSLVSRLNTSRGNMGIWTPPWSRSAPVRLPHWGSVWNGMTRSSPSNLKHTGLYKQRSVLLKIQFFYRTAISHRIAYFSAFLYFFGAHRFLKARTVHSPWTGTACEFLTVMLVKCLLTWQRLLRRLKYVFVSQLLWLCHFIF